MLLQVQDGKQTMKAYYKIILWDRMSKLQDANNYFTELLPVS